MTAQAARTPDAIAYIAGDLRVSYKETEVRANRIAHTLLRDGVGREEPVGVLLDRGEHLLPALLGVLKAGAAYVPLDPAYPSERLRLMAADSGLKTVITRPGLKPPAEARVILAGIDDADSPGHDPGTAVPEDSLAYVIYTSGSTGRPKGVALEHRSVLNQLSWLVETWGPEALAGNLASTSICFDPSVMEIFAPLLCGGTVILADNLLALPHLPARDEVTALGGPPSVLSALLRTGPLPPRTRLVHSGAEPAWAELIADIYAHPQVERVFNLYGPTECTIQCVACVIPRDGAGDPPIGRPIAGAVLSVRDADGREVPEGETGELWVGGPVVARGYLNRPDDDRFREEPGGRFYRTGDLVRFDGDMYHFAGRADDQVKIRGHRVEPGEVERALAGHPKVTAAAVLALPDADGTRRLAGYAQAEGAGERELREYLRGLLPGYMVPDRVTVLDRLPLAPNGKIDRRALADVRPAAAAGSGTPPRDEDERRVAAIVADVLGLPSVGVHDRFPELGGHSLAAARVVARAAGEFGAEVPLHEFLAEPTVEALARRLRSAPGGRAPLTRNTGRDLYPLTDMQRQFWALLQIAPDARATLISTRLRVTGTADPARFQAALDAIVRRHEPLRSVIEPVGGEPMMRVRPPAPVPLEEHDLRGLAPAEREAEILRLGGPGIAPFDLTADVPLLRAELFRTGEDTAEVVLISDHIVADGWSTRILIEELAAGLAGQDVPDPEIQLGDVALAEEERRAEALAREGAHWRKVLAGVAVPHDLFGREGVSLTHRGRRARRPLDPELDAAIRRVAAELGATPAAVHLAALATVTGGLSGRAETMIGLTAAERDRPGLERVMGPLFGTVPIPLRFEDDPEFGDLVAAANTAITGALAHRELVGSAASDALPRPPGAVPTPVMLSVQPEDVPVVLEASPGGGAAPIRVELAGELDCGCAMGEMSVLVNAGADGPELLVEYATERFTEEDAGRVADALLRALELGLADPRTRVSELPLVPGEELAALRAAGTGAEVRPRATFVDAILEHDRDGIAAESAGGRLTYGELEELSARVATGLVAAGVVPGEAVGACLPRDHRLPAVLLGVIRAGAAYVAMDADLPAGRMNAIVEDGGVLRVLALGEEAHAAVAGIGGAEVLDAAALLETPRGRIPEADPDGPAYLIFTSGSTGRPKGIEITQRGLAAYVASHAEYPGIKAGDAVLAAAPMVFDSSVFDLWATLAAGARVVIADSVTALDGRALAELCDSAGVTMVLTTPSRLRLMVESGWRGRPGMRVKAGGEALDPALARRLLAISGEVWNVYGPAETTVASTAHRVTEPVGDSVPVGRPMPGERLYVVDPLGRALPTGVPGELWIGGAGVAVGYRGRPDLTAAAFVPDPESPEARRYRTGDVVRWTRDAAGEPVLDFVGRADGQVKVRGYRIELGEVDNVVRGHPAVADFAVVATTGADAHLIGHVVWRGTGTTAELEEYAAARLPGYMVPRRWASHEALPYTATGKIDRRALAGVEAEAAAYTPPEGPMQEFMAEIWQETFGLPRVGARDDFFALGGTSLLATRVTVRLREALACDLTVRALFDHPVLADYAAAVERLVISEMTGQEDQS
ncbi:amino acid adenylation domain-containing protein [Bailinhaonella thermotolerans]|uniref:Amino acid adenylation domain-containing protein n=2 Tax=Bailinhaonella thermotolerans TaxID=1070861 RepID=A0A3A4BEN4_9ACTN|nr:amino acid adenylation domain-containing protein [Bailinhaonella thermotolerans]